MERKMKQSIDSKGLPANVFAYEEHINGNCSLLTEMAVTRAELAVLVAHYRAQVDGYKLDRERFPEDGISSREWACAVYAARRLKRIEEELAKESTYEGLEGRPDCERIEPEICPVCSPVDFNSNGTVRP
jgi:hypothetical protein